MKVCLVLKAKFVRMIWMTWGESTRPQGGLPVNTMQMCKMSYIIMQICFNSCSNCLPDFGGFEPLVPVKEQEVHWKLTAF